MMKEYQVNSVPVFFILDENRVIRKVIHAVFADFCRACNACLCRDYGIGTDIHIMSDLYQVIKLYSFVNNSRAHDANYFWAVEEVSNEAYNPNEAGIRIKYNNGDVKDITEASDMFNLQVLSKEVTKYYLCYWPVY